MRSNFAQHLHKSWLVVLRPKLSGNLKTKQWGYRMSNAKLGLLKYWRIHTLLFSFVIARRLLKLIQTWKYCWTSEIACRVKVNFCRSWKRVCDWLSGGNGMAASGKQAFVGRRERTSLKAPAGEAIWICVLWMDSVWSILPDYHCPAMGPKYDKYHFREDRGWCWCVLFYGHYQSGHWVIPLSQEFESLFTSLL